MAALRIKAVILIDHRVTNRARKLDDKYKIDWIIDGIFWEWVEMGAVLNSRLDWVVENGYVLLPAANEPTMPPAERERHSEKEKRDKDEERKESNKHKITRTENKENLEAQVRLWQQD